MDKYRHNMLSRGPPGKGLKDCNSSMNNIRFRFRIQTKYILYL